MIGTTTAPSESALLAVVTPPGTVSVLEAVGPGADQHLAGRRAAARAVTALGGLGRVAGRRGERPAWPPTVVGSISHTARWAAAVAGRSTDHAAVGLDLEVAGALPAEDAVVVCSAVERSVLAGLPQGPKRDSMSTLLWVAKEAAFKAWDAWSAGALRGVDPTLLEVDVGASGAVHAQPACQLVERGLGLPLLSGRWGDGCGLVAVVLAAPAGPAAVRIDVEGSS